MGPRPIRICSPATTAASEWERSHAAFVRARALPPRLSDSLPQTSTEPCHATPRLDRWRFDTLELLLPRERAGPRGISRAPLSTNKLAAHYLAFVARRCHGLATHLWRHGRATLPRWRSFGVGAATIAKQEPGDQAITPAGLGAGPGALAVALFGWLTPRGAAALGFGPPQGADPAARAQERRADGGARHPATPTK